MTVHDALVRGRACLSAFEDEGRFDALRLFEEIAGRNAAWILAHRDDDVPGDVIARYDVAIATRATGVPVAYVLGSVGFYGRTFGVTRDVLVPRPETEAVVECALAAARERDDACIRICDVGTGSGILAVTLACELARVRVTAIDLSEAALGVARENARRHGVAGRVRFVCGDVLSPLDPRDDDDRFDCIVANLPYVRRGDLAARPDPTAFEPVLALDGGPDGLDAYRALLARAPAHLRSGGTLVMEAGPDTVPGLAALAEAAFAAPADIVVHRDLALHERIVVVHLPRGVVAGQG
ncbi:MAG: peptide chain release factor N(5)-glutamine methyltransferase [Vulcanimicrobiaceae bacterium]